MLQILALSASRARHVKKKLLAQCIGYLQSTCLALPNGRLHLIDLYNDLNSKAGWSSSIVVRLSNRSVAELKNYWLNIPCSEVGRSWFPPEKTHVLQFNLVSDASKYAWGAHLTRATSHIFHNGIAQGHCQAQGHPTFLRGIFD